ncbi:MAG: GGDEF domain-containing protein [Acidobacteria bacterium]|nr:GGDEF domain-containing protein [Acidobacteriota bacterium]
MADRPGADSEHVQDAVELRTHVARSLQARAEAIVKDTIAVYAFAGMEGVALGDRTRFAGLLFQLITHTVREGTLDSRTATVAELGQMMGEKDIDVHVAFNVVYLMERSALDELAAEESFGATSQPWPVIAQMVRRASFDVCAAFSEYATREKGSAGIVDSLTTLQTRAVFLAALEKEVQRAERFGHPFALILLDVDRLAEINATHGYGAGDRVIERIGIVVRNYFRETDWVARSSGDGFAVLLPETQRANAERLADRVRIMVQERLQLRDYRSDQQFPVTVSVGVLIAESVDQSVRAEQLLTEAEEAADRAKKAGGNRVERVDAVIGRAVTPTRDGMSID